MLASPFLPSSMFSQHNSDESIHYRPSKDMDTFNSLLPPPIEFVEGSSSGTLAVAEGKYEAINASPQMPKAELNDAPKHTSSNTNASKVTPSAPRTPSAKTASLHSAPIDISWPVTCSRGTGLYNSGNTCFLNSALQCLLHTPPLLKLLFVHRKEDCRVSSGFCMACGLRQVAVRSHASSATTFSPSSINNNLQVIAKHMRKGRQEDTHEFLRYAIDALQKSCLAGHPPKLDPRLAETTWVHKLFGGRLRSQVKCSDCGHNSDTFDRILDLSLDIFRCDSLKGALRKFVEVDHLKGADKYKCEKCKKHVNAEKQFTLHEAPLVLTVHLKRFSPLGRKLSHPLQYDETLSLQHYMSEGAYGPTYSLYGVICHAGGGPNSGHYYAFVKSREGRWFEMNDEMVQPTSPPTDKKNAYMLFYIQNKGQSLEAAVKAPLANGFASAPPKTSLAAGMKKKASKPRDMADEEDKGVKLDAPMIGPLQPSSAILANGTAPSTHVDPQASVLKSKIQAAAKKAVSSKALESLGNYDSDTDSAADSDDTPASLSTKMAMDTDLDGKQSRESGRVVDSTRPSSPLTVPQTSPSLVIPPSRFYGNGNSSKKRRFSESESQNANKRPGSAIQARTTGYVTKNPYGKPLGKRKRMGI
ncbi:cysteine proteinase [Pholiota conissans]|uniref:Ubiquitin carboxyl-terminal hydrolase n=1 Tax=Pholiota conissans TaxID=109636 RepID=A0A9P6D2W0_9AGAR|nr:cysteine proteinase [Pholiota conissans]